MTVRHHQLLVATAGRGFTEISADLRDAVAEAGEREALCHCFLHHTSASLIVMENADPDVLHDLEGFMGRLVIDGDPHFKHVAEGDDDMSAHIRMALTHTSLTIPVREGKLDLGTWQGVYLWEHREAGHRRRITVTISA
ncbi:MAG: secondary thiamine-phosphate synthase enzyme YjbQ [Pseudomonadota bacterium]